MFFIHQMVTGSEGHQVGIVGWRRDGDWAGTAHISVTQLVGEQLEFISSKTIVIPEHMVVRGTAGALQEKKKITFAHLSAKQDNIRFFSSRFNP